MVAQPVMQQAFCPFPGLSTSPPSPPQHTHTVLAAPIAVFLSTYYALFTMLTSLYTFPHFIPIKFNQTFYSCVVIMAV